MPERIKRNQKDYLFPRRKELLASQGINFALLQDKICCISIWCLNITVISEVAFSIQANSMRTSRDKPRCAMFCWRKRMRNVHLHATENYFGHAFGTLRRTSQKSSDHFEVEVRHWMPRTFPRLNRNCFWGRRKIE